MLSTLRNSKSILRGSHSRLYVTSSLKPLDIFGGQRPHAFAACVGRVSDIPDLHGVPEVRQRLLSERAKLLRHTQDHSHWYVILLYIQSGCLQMSSRQSKHGKVNTVSSRPRKPIYRSSEDEQETCTPRLVRPARIINTRK